MNTLGTVPDSDTDINEYFIKLTGNPAQNHLINASFRYRGIKADHADIGNFTAPSSGSTPKTIDRVFVGSWYWIVNPKTTIEARFNHNEDNNSVAANIVVPFKSAPFNAAAPYLSGAFVTGHSTKRQGLHLRAGQPGRPEDRAGVGGGDLAPNDQNFFRDEYRLQTSYFSNFLGATHDIKAGVTMSVNREDLSRASNGWGTITITDSSNCGPVAARPCYRARFPSVPADLARNDLRRFPQDQATWNHLTVNVGVLVNEDYYIPNDDGSFSFIRGNPATPGNATPFRRAAQPVHGRLHLHRPHQHPLEQTVAAAHRHRLPD